MDPAGRTTSVFDLPIDVLHLIVDNFRDEQLWSNGRINWTWHFGTHGPHDGFTTAMRTIQNIRLVCRLLHNVASPHLCRVLRVDLSQASLDRANGLLKNPHIAEGIHGIQVVLDYRPAELAHNIERFSACRIEDFRRIYNRCEFCSGDRSRTDEDEEIGTWYRYSQCMNEYMVMCDSWKDYLERKGSLDLNELDSYQEILCQTFQQYNQKHEEQLQLIEEGLFVGNVASMIAELGHAVSLDFRDQIRPFETPNTGEDWTVIILDKKELAQAMVKPQTWDTIESLPGGASLVPARILTELPIAVSKAGGLLNGLHIDCFPIMKDHSLIWSPGSEDWLYRQWTDFRVACANLDIFEFANHGMRTLPIRSEQIPSSVRIYIDKYVSAALGSRKLENLDIRLRALGLNDGRLSTRSQYRIGTSLRAIGGPSLRRVALGNVSITQTELESFCKSLGPKVESLSLTDVELLNGHWQEALEVLRDKVHSRCAEGRCDVYFASLSGGEFGMEPRIRNAWDALLNPAEAEEEFDEGNPENPAMVKRAQTYVSGIELELTPPRTPVTPISGYHD
jgi:hypothetical protein